MYVMTDGIVLKVLDGVGDSVLLCMNEGKDIHLQSRTSSKPLSILQGGYCLVNGIGAKVFTTDGEDYLITLNPDVDILGVVYDYGQLPPSPNGYKIDWIERYITDNRGKPMKLNKAQVDILTYDEEALPRLVACGRQVGLSTAITCDAYYYAMRGKCKVIIAAPHNSMLDIYHRCISADSGVIVKDSREMITFNNGSIIYLVSIGSRSCKVRGLHVDRLYIDCADFCSKDNIEGVIPCGKPIIIGTSGLDTDDDTIFKKMYMDSNNKLYIPSINAPNGLLEEMRKYYTDTAYRRETLMVI